MRIITDKLVTLFEIAGTTERLMPGVKKPKATEMYEILEMSYDRKDDGYWKSEGKLRLRANSKQTNVSAHKQTVSIYSLRALTNH